MLYEYTLLEICFSSFMSGLTQSMNFWQRIWNFLIKMFFARPFMYFHTYTIDQVKSNNNAQSNKISD